MHDDATHDLQHGERWHERGWTLVELLVAMAIATFLIGGATLSLSSAKANNVEREAKLAAASYEQAIARYMADYANVLPASRDWRFDQTRAWLGPRNLVDRAPSNRFSPLQSTYLQTVSSSLNPTSGTIGVSNNGTTNCQTALGRPLGAASRHLAWISYCTRIDGTALASPGYALRVITRRPGNPRTKWTQKEGAKICWRGRAATAADDALMQPRC